MPIQSDWKCRSTPHGEGISIELTKSTGEIIKMYVHGDNLEQKEHHNTKYIDAASRNFLKEIREKYNPWKKANIDLKGPYSKPSADDEKIIREAIS